MDLRYYGYLAIILLVSIGLHEYAHAYFSYKFWDPTPKLQGRLTPNPFKHVDLVWFFLIFVIGFGWWKPVQINPMYYKRPLRDELVTSLAGPAMNLCLALIGMLLMMGYARLMWIGLQTLILEQFDLVLSFWFLFISINLGLAVFNLLPIFPLDGYRLIKIIRPKVAMRMEQHAMVLTIALLVLILGPGSGVIGRYISLVVGKLYDFLFMVSSQIFY